MEIQIIKEPINRSTLENIAIDQFIDLVKAVVDVEQEIMAIGGEFHSDEEVELISKEGSLRENTWGINFYIKGDEFIEYDSMINLKPSINNNSRNIEDNTIKKKILEITNRLIQ